MPQNFPESEQEIFDRSLSDFQNELSTAGPFLKNNFAYAMIAAFSGRVYDNYQLVEQLLLQMFPDTATGDYLARWGGYVGITKLPATISSGNITATGTVGSSILLGTNFQTSDSKIFQSTSACTIAAQSFSVSSITRSGNTATVTTSGNHNFATGIAVTMSGAVQTDYNGSFPIVVTADNQFTYTVNNSPTTPATGTIVASANCVTVPVQSQVAGVDYNLISGTQLSLITPIVGISTNQFVQYSGLVGGTDIEVDDRYRDRIIYKYQNPVNLFNVFNIVDTIKKLSFVDRVFVQEITPSIGQVTIYILKSPESSNIIPTTTELNQVITQLLTIKPANVSPADIFVLAPTAVPVNFTFTALDPATVTMQTAILESLETLFNEKLSVGEYLTRAAYESAIYQTVDLATGSYINSFTLSTPNSDIAIASSQIATLGTITYSLS